MKAVIWTKYGAPDGLVVGEMEKPIPKDDEILIKVMATTATLGDCEIRSMSLPLAFKFPMRLYFGFFKPRKGKTLGQEFSGIVTQVGNSVKRFKPGDEVFGQASMKLGAYAQYMKIAEEGIVSTKPNNVSFEEASCVPLGGLEARYFTGKADIARGGHVLVIGAGGSIGTMGIQLLKLLGAEVTGVDTGEKFGAMNEAGADHCIDFTKQDYLNDGATYDGILDVVGKTPLKMGLALLNDHGVYMHANPKISHRLFRKRVSKSAGKRILVKVDEQSQQDLDALADLLENGKIRPVIDTVMTLEEIVPAHEYVEAGKKKGNLVIKVWEDELART